MAKSLKGTTAEEWRAHEVKFTYKGKQYNVPIESNLVLNDLSVDEIKDHLNEVPGRLSYWSSFQIQVSRKMVDLETDFEVWFHECYMDVDAEYPKKTEGWKKAKVMLDNSDEYRTMQKALRDLQDVGKRIAVLTAGYNTQTWTLREIARLTQAEMSNIELHGKGNLSDIT